MISKLPKILPYRYIIILSMLFITIDLAAVSVSYKMVSINSIFELNSAATFIFPMTYALGDIVTEVYGYNMAKKLIWLSLLLQFIFAILVVFAINLPSPIFLNRDNAYFIVFGNILRFVLAGTVANIVSNFINVYVVSKLKIPMEGRFFWFRSILSTIISGFIMAAIIVIVGFLGSEIDLLKAWIMFKSTFSCEIFYAFILVIPAAIATKFLKQSEKVDVYDYNTNFNPFLFT